MQAAVQRQKNKGYYRVLHVPIWIWVFFTLPGELTAQLYEHGFTRWHALWITVVAVVCIWRGAKGRLPGAEARPYITHYGLDWPNLGYRIACYTAGWIAIVSFWLLNLIGLAWAAAGGQWIIAALYGWPYDLVALGVVLVAAANRLPRARRTIINEGAERAWFYIGVWCAVPAQAAGWAMWRLGPAMGFEPPTLRWARLVVFATVSALMLALGFAGALPRTRRYHYQTGAVELQPAAGE